MEDRLIERAAREAMNPVPERPRVVQQNTTLPVEGLARLVECGVLTPEQLYRLIFEQKAPDRYRGQPDPQ